MFLNDEKENLKTSAVIDSTGLDLSQVGCNTVSCASMEPKHSLKLTLGLNKSF